MLQLCAHKHGKLTGKWQLASHCVFLPKPRVTDWANWRCERMGRCSLAAWVRDPLDIKAPRLHVRHQVHLTSVSGPPPPPCRDWSDSHSEGPSPRLPQPKGTPVTLHAARPTICDTAPLPPDLQQPGVSARAHTPLRPTAPHYAPIRPTTPQRVWPPGASRASRLGLRVTPQKYSLNTSKLQDRLWKLRTCSCSQASEM